MPVGVRQCGAFSRPRRRELTQTLSGLPSSAITWFYLQVGRPAREVASRAGKVLRAAGESGRRRPGAALGLASAARSGIHRSVDAGLNRIVGRSTSRVDPAQGAVAASSIP